MKKYLILMFLLSMAVGASAQLTIKTGNGKTVEIDFHGAPVEVIVVNDSIILRARNDKVESGDSVGIIKPAGDVANAKDEPIDSADVAPSSPESTAFGASPKQTTLGMLANSLAEGISPEYAEFNKEHEGAQPTSEKEVVKNIAKEFVNEDVVETADFLTTLFGSLRLSKDSTFVPVYEQRKPKKSVRAYNIIELEGHLGKNISQISDMTASQMTTTATIRPTNRNTAAAENSPASIYPVRRTVTVNGARIPSVLRGVGDFSQHTVMRKKKVLTSTVSASSACKSATTLPWVRMPCWDAALFLTTRSTPTTSTTVC